MVVESSLSNSVYLAIYKTPKNKCCHTQEKKIQSITITVDWQLPLNMIYIYQNTLNMAHMLFQATLCIYVNLVVFSLYYRSYISKMMECLHIHSIGASLLKR